MGHFFHFKAACCYRDILCCSLTRNLCRSWFYQTEENGEVYSRLSMKCACTTGPADCVVIWSPWTPCNVVCGTGVKWRFSRIVTFPRNGGRPCPPIVEAAPCESIRCNPMLAPNDWQDALRGTLEYSVYCSYVFGRVCLNVCVSADF